MRDRSISFISPAGESQAADPWDNEISAGSVGLRPRLHVDQGDYVFHRRVTRRHRFPPNGISHGQIDDAEQIPMTRRPVCARREAIPSYRVGINPERDYVLAEHRVTCDAEPVIPPSEDHFQKSGVGVNRR